MEILEAVDLLYKIKRGNKVDEKTEEAIYLALDQLMKELVIPPVYRCSLLPSDFGKNYSCKCGMVFYDYELPMRYCRNCGQRLY